MATFQASDVQVANTALRHLAQTNQIQSLDTDATPQAQACRAFYADCRDEVLRDFPWPFATKFAQLALVTQFPLSEYRYSYRYPSDCLAIRRIPSGLRNDNRQSLVVYKIGQDASGLLIFTDWQNAVQATITPPATQPQPLLIPDIEYTFQAYNSALWPSDYRKALALYLASEISFSLTKGDPFHLGDKALSRYHEVMSIARAKAANEQAEDPQVESEFVRVRNGDFQTRWPANNWSPYAGGFSVQ